MSSVARKKVFESEVVGTYHCTSRIVARRFLMGVDERTGQDFSHRKDLVEIRHEQLGKVLMIDFLGYTILDNHVDHYLRNRPDLVAKLDDREVVRRSLMISPGDMPNTEELEEPTEEQIDEQLKDEAYIERARERLSDISWYMKCLNEAIARRINREEKVSGSFWEGRFHMTRMLDSTAALLRALEST